MGKRVLYYNRDLSLIRKLRSEGKLSMYIFLCSVKQSQTKDHALSFQDFKKAYLKCGYSKATVRVYMNRLVELGWANKSAVDGSIYLMSYKKVAAEYGANLKFPKKVYGKTQKELLARASCIYLEVNAKAQAKKVFKVKKTMTVKIVQSYDNTGQLGTSVRYLSKLVGYKSARSGSNCYKEMVRLGMIERKNRVGIVCPVSEFDEHTAKEFNGRLFIDKRDNMVKQRLKSLTKFTKN